MFKKVLGDTGRIVGGGMYAFIIAAAATTLPRVALAEEDSIIEEVVVTGSRIARSNETASQPLSLISAEDLTQVGQTDIGEILNDQPALLSSVTSTNSIDAAATNITESDNVGGAALDLRGLGIERTLTLVNGRRHVSGVEGTSAVDIGTIPSALIERVEVLTGGASAIYGADAVTGVVNFVLKDDYEGMEFNVQTGLSSESDSESNAFSGLFGRNFNDGRGNIVFAAQYETRTGIRQGDRSYLRGSGLYDNDTNPELRFQNGDITAGNTPNFSQYYNYDNTGLFPVGLQIPDADTFVADYTAQFGSAPTLTAAEQALISRASNAFPQVFLPGRTFNITSPYGIVALGDFGVGATPLGSEPDLDGNGVSDCLDSFTGYNSSLAGAGSFGAAGGCWAIDENGNPLTPLYNYTNPIEMDWYQTISISLVPNRASSRQTAPSSLQMKKSGLSTSMDAMSLPRKWRRSSNPNTFIRRSTLAARVTTSLTCSTVHQITRSYLKHWLTWQTMTALVSSVPVVFMFLAIRMTGDPTSAQTNAKPTALLLACGATLTIWV